MAINKRFTHLNHSGSNHSILDAESAYITGTLQVGPDIPVLGTDVNFFVSGNIGGAGGATPGVGVFGGDLVVSGNLIVEGTFPSGGENYFWSPANAEIEASGSLHISESFRALSLSASNGAEITGSTTFNVVAPNQSVIISGSGNTPYALDIVESSTFNGTVFYVDPGNIEVGLQNPLQPNDRVVLNNGSGYIYTRTGNQVVTLNSQLQSISLTVTSSAPTGSLQVYDDLANPGVLDVIVGELRFNGDPGVSGYALTSSGPGVAPGWAPIPSASPNYWIEEVPGEIFTSASIVHVPSGSLEAQFLSSSTGIETSGSITIFTDPINNPRSINWATATDIYTGILLIDATGSGFGPFAQAYGDIARTTGHAFVGDSKFIAMITGSNQGFFSGSYKFHDGISGSLQSLPDGSPYLLAGPYITITTNSLGQIEVSGAAPPSAVSYWDSVTNGVIKAQATSSMVEVPYLSASNGLEVTGAAYFSPEGTGRGLLKFGGLDVGPITGSMVIYAAESGGAVLSGNLISASYGIPKIPGDTAVIRHELHIVATSTNGGSGYQMFAATYLVMSFVDASGVQTVKAVTELSRETSGSYAATWDVNFNENCEVAVSGAGESNPVHWYGQRVKEMSIDTSGFVT